jgi:cation:H+ antiporter
VGSNIANTWLVLGAAALVYPLQAKSSTIYKEVPFSLIASFALLFLAYDTFFSG